MLSPALSCCGPVISLEFWTGQGRFSLHLYGSATALVVWWLARAARREGTDVIKTTV